jgi:hypothetical protein
MESISGGFIAFLVLVKRCDILSPMQGFMGYPLKSAFTWGKRPGFLAVAVTTSAFPGGCGAVILIFWSGNNPVKYTDPDGRDDQYYNASGQYIETVQSETSDVYLRTGSGEDVTNTRITTAAEFNKFTAAVFGESSGNATESEAIAHVIMNRSDYTGRSIDNIIDNSGIYGYTNANQVVADNGATSNNNTNLVNARAGVIHAFTGNDTSNGAYFWEGTAFLTPESPLYNQNNWFVRSGWGTTPGTGGIINYLETTTIGGTVFMRNNPQHHGNRLYQ